ncbi:hypothetical protein ACKKBG_A26500 [Auxenochlorella protothecoides x Auxenochlorella symbiontica]
MGDTITSLSLVELRALLLEAVRQAHDGLHAVAGALPGLEDSERKRALTSQLHASRQQLQRLGVVVAWSAKARAVAECRRVMQAAAVHAAALQDAADQLAYLHSELTATAAPAYDIATAVQVTEQGSYNLLPSSIEEHAGVSPARPPRSTVRAALAQLDFLIRAKLLQNPRPEGMAVRSISAGVLTLGGAGGLYTARLTLVPAPEERVTLAQYGAGDRAAPGGRDASEVAQVPQAWARAEGDGATAVGGPASSAAFAPATAKVKHPAAGWRWRLLSLDLLPEYRGREGLAPPQLLAWLQSVLEQRMWAAADVATLRGAGLGDLVAAGDPGAVGDARPTSSERSAPTSDAPGASSLPARSTLCLGAAGLGDESSGHEKCGAGSGPAPSPSPGPDALRLMHEALTRGAARAALASIVVPDARRLEGAEGWAGRLRLERAREGTGIRLRYWLDHPPVTLHELEALQGRSSNGSGAALPATSHALAAPDASAAAHAPPEAPAQAPSIEVALGADAESLAVQLPEAVGDPTAGWAPLRPRCSAADPDLEGLLQRVLAARAAMQLAALEGHLSAAPLGACMRCRLVVAEKEAVEPWSAAHEDVPITIATDPQPARLPRLEVWAGGCHDAGDTDGEASPASKPALTLGVDRQTGQYELLQVGEEARGGDAAGVTRPEAATTVAPPSGAGAAAGSSRAGVATASPEPSPLRRELSGALAAAAREALASPLPVGRSRATQAVALAAAVVARHAASLDAARRLRRLERAAAALGLAARPLPRRLAQAEAGMGGGGGGGAGEAAQTVALDLACAPHDPLFSSWVAARRTGAAPGAADRAPRPAGPPLSGLVAASLVVSAAPGSSGLEAEARLYEATARGLALRQLGAPPLPGALWLGDAGAGRGPLDGCVPAEPANGAAPTRKRGRGWPEGAVEPTGAPGAEAPVMAKALSPGPPQRRLTLVQALRWARREGLWRQLGHQLDALGLAASEEWRWVGAPESGGPSPMGGAAHAKPGAAGLAAREFLGGSASEPAPCGAYVRVLALPAPPGAGALDAHTASDGQTAERSGAAGAGAGVGLCAPQARFWLHGDRGEWRGELDSRYFASRAARLRDAGVELQDGCDGKAPAVEVVRCGRRGLELAGSFQRGQSVLRGVAALLSSLRLHLCLARCMARCRAAPEVEHENGEVAGEEGAAHANGGAEAKRTVSACTWRLPGSCRCRLASAGLLSATFVVEGRGPSAHGPLLTAEVLWETLGAGRGTGGGAGPGVSELGTPRASGGSPECRVLCRPEVPAALAARLAALLEAGREDSFLDGLCAAAPAAAAALAALGPGAQRAAGLAPGSLAWARMPGAGGLGGAAQHAVAVRVAQGSRGVALALAGVAGGRARLDVHATSAAGHARLVGGGKGGPAAEAPGGAAEPAPMDPAWMDELVRRLRALAAPDGARGANGAAGAPAPETAASVADADVQPSPDSSSKPAAAVASAPGTAEGDAAGRDLPPRTCTLWIPEAAVEEAATTVLQAVGGAW